MRLMPQQNDWKIYGGNLSVDDETKPEDVLPLLELSALEEKQQRQSADIQIYDGYSWSPTLHLTQHGECALDMITRAIQHSKDKGDPTSHGEVFAALAGIAWESIRDMGWERGALSIYENGRLLKEKQINDPLYFGTFVVKIPGCGFGIPPHPPVEDMDVLVYGGNLYTGNEYVDFPQVRPLKDLHQQKFGEALTA